VIRSFKRSYAGIVMNDYNTTIAMEAKAELILSLRQKGITDHKTLSAIESIPRVMFVPEEYKLQSYADQALPIEHGQTISQPFIVGTMTQALKASSRHIVLEIGTGSGYQAAILSRIARRVITLERVRPLADKARQQFKFLNISNVDCILTDGMKGWAAGAPYDRIIVTAACEAIPDELLNQLAQGGILVAPVGPQGCVQHLLRITKTEEGRDVENLMPVQFVPLLEGLARSGG
jgi:protein-L-isoaspartate(D-aspartate) O-methyltransferase